MKSEGREEEGGCFISCCDCLSPENSGKLTECLSDWPEGPRLETPEGCYYPSTGQGLGVKVAPEAATVSVRDFEGRARALTVQVGAAGMGSKAAKGEAQTPETDTSL